MFLKLVFKLVYERLLADMTHLLTPDFMMISIPFLFYFSHLSLLVRLDGLCNQIL